MVHTETSRLHRLVGRQCVGRRGEQMVSSSAGCSHQGRRMRHRRSKVMKGRQGISVECLLASSGRASSSVMLLKAVVMVGTRGTGGCRGRRRRGRRRVVGRREGRRVQGRHAVAKKVSERRKGRKLHRASLVGGGGSGRHRVGNRGGRGAYDETGLGGHGRRTHREEGRDGRQGRELARVGVGDLSALGHGIIAIVERGGGVTGRQPGGSSGLPVVLLVLLLR